MNNKVKANQPINGVIPLTSRKKKQKNPSARLFVIEPRINQLYFIDVKINGKLQKDVLARYTGQTKDGEFLNFELYSCYTTEGIKLGIVGLNRIPTKISICPINMFFNPTAIAA